MRTSVSEKASSRQLVPGEAVRKASNTNQPPYHGFSHRRVDERLAGCAQPLVILTHPPVVTQPRECTLYHQRLGKNSKPRRGSSFCQSICQPSLDHSSAQIRAVFSEISFGVRCTTSTLRPDAFSTCPFSHMRCGRSDRAGRCHCACTCKKPL